MTNFYHGKKVLVTGGLGFLGSNLSRHLVELGAKVTLLDSLLKGHGGNLFNMADFKKSVRFVKGDIRNKKLTEKIVKGQDILFNIAAQTSHTDSMKNPYLDVDINTRGQINLLEACRKGNPGIRIVYCSTRAVYGSAAKRIIDEATLPNPLDVYATNKLAGENYHRVYAKVFGLNATVLRLSNGYGPRAQMKEPSFGILNWFIRLALDDAEIKIFGDGKQVRDYAYVDDMTEAFLKTAQNNDIKGEILNIASGHGLPLINIVKEVVRIAGTGKIVHVPWPDTNKKIDVGDFIADVHKARRLIGWEASTPLKDGLAETIDFYRQNKRRYW
ncbi:MAG: hypothetical protein A2901_06165 [Elusimicrobia bacterium RIFCSPLOWO2_01_FULL_54_10]|nr:MAG: hypothetical protein A2901_06165 [Elusimicrobia bacterium RIFCSPLOWO2_01_FULL_54_10]